MAVLRVNASADGTIRAPSSALPDWRATLARMLGGLPAAAPIVILIHGYRYTWRPSRLRARDDPHHSLYRANALAPTARRKPRTANWPHELGFSENDPADGLCIALGWEARHWRPGLDCFARVHRAAGRTAETLAGLLGAIAAAAPGRRVDCLCHSLGARVILQALRHAPSLPVDRVVLLGAAEYAGEARMTLLSQDHTGARTDFYHVIARANDVYDQLFTIFAPPPPEPGDMPLGARGLGVWHPRWLDLQLDHPEVRSWLSGQGLAPQRAADRVSHWSFYADPGAMAVYRTILRRRPSWSITAMRARGVPLEIEPRWSRLLPPVRWRHGDEAMPDGARA